METIINLVIITTICTFSYFLGKFSALHLPEISRMFDKKPFNCHPCFSFHIAWASSSIAAIILNSISLFTLGIIAAFVLYTITKKINNQKIIK